jgi:lipopolysaccharide transport system permease protein
MEKSQDNRFVVSPPTGAHSPPWQDFAAYREVLAFLIWRDVKVRYRQSVLGSLWAILQPLTMMAVFALFFGYLARIPSDGIPYPVYVLAALVPWQLFANSVSSASASLVRNEDLVRRVYFPRVFIVLSSLGVGLLDFALTFVLLVIFASIYGVGISANILYLPVFVLLALATALGVGLWLSALNARYRDIQLATPFLLQTWLFASPIVYSSSAVPEAWRSYYALNPMVGVVDGVRWSLFGQPGIEPLYIGISALIALVTSITGWVYFHHTQHTFADVL